MRIEILKEGKVFKNYRDLCEQLEIPVKRGNSKNSQIKEIGRYCLLMKGTGHQLIVKEIYDTALPETALGRKSLYGDLLDLILMDYLIANWKKTGDYAVTITRNNLLKEVNIINTNYSFCSQNVPHLATYTEIDEKTIYDFFNTSSSLFKYSIEASLKRLRNRALAMTNTALFLCETIKGTPFHRQASDDEIDIILKSERKTLKDWDYDNMSQVRASKKWKVFQTEVMRRVNETSPKIQYYYNCYQVTINKTHIEGAQEELLYETLMELEREEKQEELNSVIIERLIINAEARQKKPIVLDSYMFKVRKNFGYISSNKKLTDILIDRNARSIAGEIETIKRLKSKEN